MNQKTSKNEYSKNERDGRAKLIKRLLFADALAPSSSHFPDLESNPNSPPPPPTTSEHQSTSSAATVTSLPPTSSPILMPKHKHKK